MPVILFTYAFSVQAWLGFIALPFSPCPFFPFTFAGLVSFILDFRVDMDLDLE
jgi:hypothetical protein